MAGGSGTGGRSGLIISVQGKAVSQMAVPLQQGFLSRIRIDVCQPSKDVRGVAAFNPRVEVLDCPHLLLSAGV